MKRTLPLMLTLCMAAACGDATDPSVQPTPTPDMSGNNQMDMGGTPTDMNTTPPDMPTTPPDMNNNNNNNNNMMPDMTQDMGSDMGGSACGPDSRFNGQVGGNKTNDGGTPASSDASYADDAGIEALWNLFKAKNMAGEFPENDPATMRNECSDLVSLSAAEQVQITGAVVTSTSFSGRRFTIQDKKRAQLVFLDMDKVPRDGAGMPVVIKVGQRLNFKVTGVKRFACATPQISEVADFEIAAATGDVFVEDKSGQDLEVERDLQKLVRIGGRITAFNDACGGSGATQYFCYVLTHGQAPNTKDHVLRTNSMFARQAMSVGECVTYVGPINDFPGVFADSPGVQLNGENFDWVRFPFR